MGPVWELVHADGPDGHLSKIQWKRLSVHIHPSPNHAALAVYPCTGFAVVALRQRAQGRSRHVGGSDEHYLPVSTMAFKDSCL